MVGTLERIDITCKLDVRTQLRQYVQMLQRLKSLATRENFAGAWIALVAVPFFALAFWNHPSADDFSYAANVIDRGFWGHTGWLFVHWSGRFFSNPVTSLTPALLGSGEHAVSLAGLVVYRIVALLIAAGFFWSLWYALASVNAVFVRASKTTLLGVYAFLITAVLVTLASPAELFYWYPASVAYAVPWISFFVALGLFARYCGGSSRRGVLLTAIVLCLVLTIGTQEMSLMVSLISVFAIGVLLLKRLRANKIWRRAMFWLGSTLILASTVAIFSPGNFGRKEIWLERGYAQYSQGERIASWSSDLIKTFFDIATSTRLLVLVVLSLPLLFMIARSLAGRYRPVKPIWSVLLLGAYWVGMSLPALVASSPELLGAGRTMNAYSILTAVMFFAITTHILWWMLAKVGPMQTLLTPLSQQLQNTFKLRIVWLVLVAVMGLWVLGSSSSWVSLAWRNTLSGSAASYSRQLNERYSLLRESVGEALTVPHITDVPTTLFFDDITNDPRDWRNTSYARFFGLESVVRD